MKNKISYIPESWEHANSYIIHGAKDYLIDPSIPYDQKIADNLNGIIATHFHYDHISQVEIWREKTGLDFMMPEGDIPFLTDPEANCSAAYGEPVNYSAADYYYTDQEKIQLEPDLRLIVYHTPGHTPGCSCILLQIQENDIYQPLALISGDTLFSNSIGRTDLKGGNHADMEKSLIRLTKILQSLPQDLPVLPGHGSPFLIRDAFRFNPFIRQYL
ncbi:MAG: MBL fold metallo-hydrolase [Saccharofermentanales bacterium]